jgi:hypothetical protein
LEAHYEQEAEANFTNDAPMNVNSRLGYKLEPSGSSDVVVRLQQLKQ